MEKERRKEVSATGLPYLEGEMSWRGYVDWLMTDDYLDGILGSLLPNLVWSWVLTWASAFGQEKARASWMMGLHLRVVLLRDLARVT